MKIGNVIRSPRGSLWIVSALSDKYVSIVSFDTPNMSGVMPLEDRTYTGVCGCEGQDVDCDACSGTGAISNVQKGWKHSVVLASSVQEFLLDGFKRMFNLERIV